MLPDADYLKQTLALAQLGRGFCAPNPAVGALIVDHSGQIIARGYHKGFGLDHAEVDALKTLPAQQAPGATLYVSSEPCHHWGKTPPCTEAILRAGIKRVVYALRDPNPIVAGKGADFLNKSGIQCEHHPLPEADAFYQSYCYWHSTHKPLITAKIAISLDAKIAGPEGQPIAISGPLLKTFTHEQRYASDALLTTCQTITRDDPQLNARLGDQTVAKPLYVLDRHLHLPLNAKVWTSAASLTLFHAESASAERREALMRQGARCIAVPEGAEGLDLATCVAAMGKDGRHDVWVEAGGKCFVSLIEASLVQKAYIYIAPKCLGVGIEAFSSARGLGTLPLTAWRQYGPDVLAEFSWLKSNN